MGIKKYDRTSKSLRYSFLFKSLICIFFLTLRVYTSSFSDQKDIYDLFKREINNLEYEKFENYTDIVKNMKLNQGELIMENFKIGTNPQEIREYIYKKYDYDHNINDKINTINITNLIIIHKADFIKSFGDIKLSNAITILRKNIKNPLTFDLFSLFTISSAELVNKVYENKECYGFLGVYVCSDSTKSVSFTYNAHTNYLMENILNSISMEKMKKIMDSHSLSIFLQSDEKFDLVNVNENLDFYYKSNMKDSINFVNRKNNFISELNFLEQQPMIITGSNIIPGTKEENYLNSLINTIKKYRIYYSEKKIEIENLQNKYESILSKEGYRSDKNSRMQMVTGINKADIDSYLSRLKKKYEVPFDKQVEFDATLESTVMASKNIWTYIDFVYSKNNDGKIKYLAIFSMEDKNELFNLLIYELLYDFVLGKNILLITKTNYSSYGINIQNEIIQETPVESNGEFVKDLQTLLSENAIKSFANYLKIED